MSNLERPHCMMLSYVKVDEKLLATTKEFLELQHEVGQILSHDFCRSCIQDIQAIAQSKPSCD